MSIRSTAKAIIFDEGRILLNRCRDADNGEYDVLPGGGQETGETLTEAIRREVLEETGYSVEPVRFCALCEEICDDEAFRRARPEYAHKMLHIFLCKKVDAARVRAAEPDSEQIGEEWVAIADLAKRRILPEMLGERIEELITSDQPVFLGSRHIPKNHG